MSPEQQEQLQAAWNEEAAARAAPKGDAPPAEETPLATEQAPEEPAPEQQQATTEQTPEAPDPAKRVEELATLNAQLQERLRRVEGHIGGLTSELKRTKDQLTAGHAVAQAVTDAPTTSQMAEAANPEAWQRLKDDFPEWAAGVEAYMNARVAGIKPSQEAPSTEQFQQSLQQQEAALRADFNRQLAEMQVEVRHEGWKQTVATPEFNAWYAKQNDEVRGLAGSDKPKDAVRLLDLYNSAKTNSVEAIANDRRTRLAASATPKGSAAPTRKSEEGMTAKEYWEYLARQRGAATA